mgnify:CR=1 FL=1
MESAEKLAVVAVFDVGKTNKKLFLFDELYQVVFERSARFTETVDEDGDACENLDSLRLSIFDSLREVFADTRFELKAINFASYGASLVFIDERGLPLTPLYNYLKTYPDDLKEEFYQKYGGEELFAVRTASPVLGSLNSGMQFYRLKREQPEVFEKVAYALHLPQYLSFLLSGKVYSDKTSLGCHTNFWDFAKQRYHPWVEAEGLLDKMAPVVGSTDVFAANFPGNNYSVGVGLHDSSAALIPYLKSFREPFILLSTGTWSISMNPFNQSPLTTAELEQDVLCYMQYEGTPVKASRLFSGYNYEQQLKRIASHFNVDMINFRNVSFDPEMGSNICESLLENKRANWRDLPFAKRPVSDFMNEMEAYYQLVEDLVVQQYHATQLVLQESAAKRIFVDGGFSRNSIFMNLLAIAFADREVYAAHMPQATAIGAALAIHHAWNSRPLPNDIIELRLYTPTAQKIKG